MAERTTRSRAAAKAAPRTRATKKTDLENFVAAAGRAAAGGRASSSGKERDMAREIAYLDAIREALREPFVATAELGGGSLLEATDISKIFGGLVDAPEGGRGHAQCLGKSSLVVSSAAMARP